MARRSDHSRNEIAQMILDSTFDIIVEHGVEGVSTRRIANRIGYTVGTLYNVYSNLDDILLHINARTIDILIDTLQSGLGQQQNKQDAEERLYIIAHKYLDFAITNYNLWHVLFEYRLPEEADIPDWYRSKLAQIFSIVDSIVVDLVDQEEKAKEIAGIIWASIHGICSLSIKNKLTKVGFTDASYMIDKFLGNYLTTIK